MVSIHPHHIYPNDNTCQGEKNAVIFYLSIILTFWSSNDLLISISFLNNLPDSSCLKLKSQFSPRFLYAVQSLFFNYLKNFLENLDDGILSKTVKNHQFDLEEQQKRLWLSKYGLKLIKHLYWQFKSSPYLM